VLSSAARSPCLLLWGPGASLLFLYPDPISGVSEPRGWLLRACTWPPQGPQHGGVGEDRRRTDRTDELISELRDRVRSLENQLRQERAANRENRRIISSLTNGAPKLPAAPETGRREPARRRIRSSWWKEKYASAMVGMLTAFAVLAANGEENPLRLAKPGGEEQARVPTTTQPAPPPEPAPSSGPAPAPEPAPASEPASEPAPAPAPGEAGPVGTEPVPTEPVPTDPVR
jgi:hypothetical protein